MAKWVRGGDWSYGGADPRIIARAASGNVSVRGVPWLRSGYDGGLGTFILLDVLSGTEGNSDLELGPTFAVRRPHF